jgi:hypothetical protein
MAQSEYTDAERDAVLVAAMNYLEGAETNDAERMAAAVHPELYKVLLAQSQTGEPFLQSIGATLLVEVVRAGAGFLPEDQRIEPDVRVHNIDRDMASVSVTSKQWVDHLLLAKWGDEWKIMNVLWIPAPEADAPTLTDAELAAEKEAVTATVLDYAEGAYSATAERMARAIHPELNKKMVYTHPQTGGQFVVYSGPSQLIEGTRAGRGRLEEDQWDIEVEVYEVGHDLACAKLFSARFIDNLQLVKVNGEWKIINVLWVPNRPAAGE